MDYEDYYKRTWKVITQDPTAECPFGSEVTFAQDKVVVSCGGKPTYEGIYFSDSNTIKGDGYEIRMVQCIKFMPTEGLRAGSWTAEDQGPWPGDE